MLLSSAPSSPTSLHLRARRSLAPTSTSRSSFFSRVSLTIHAEQSPAQESIKRGQLESRSTGQSVEMNRGDWICQKCKFMNFARNMNCLECHETRPKRMLTGKEWECPQCDFFNYGKNISCLRCDCKRPGETVLNSPRPLTGENEKSSFESTIGERLDQILGRSSSAPSQSTAGTSPGSANRFSYTERRQTLANQRRDPGYVPFVPLPTDMFSRSQETNNEPKNSSDKEDPADSQSKDAVWGSDESSKSSEKPAESNVSMSSNKQSDQSDRWFKRVASLHDNTDPSSEISGEDFPDIMPMRKGENRFVVSKKKDRSLTSPQYKRRMAMEQANNSSFVPFVPFPPGYFAKKDKQMEAGSAIENSAADSSSSSGMDKTTAEAVKYHSGVSGSLDSDVPEIQRISRLKSQLYSNEHSGRSRPGQISNDSSVKTTSNPVQPSNEFSSKNHEHRNDGALKSSTNGSPARSSSQKIDNSQVRGENSEQGLPHKSLEGSAVTEPDPLDMSEEAKAQRWFRRAAQIKDISELSNIPDEDFPEIMPMRKGVNKFVVSKRKTPLERRLTSQQYRRNLPIVNSEPETGLD